MRIELSIKQIYALVKAHDLPQAYMDRLTLALRAAFDLGHNADVMQVKHKKD